MKVLSADDHSIFRAGLRPLVRQIDPEASFFEADTYNAALDVLESNPDCDLVLLDLLMPGMDAFEGLTSIRENSPQIPVVIVSAIENRQDVLQAIDMGALGYIPKSADTDEMLKAIRQVLDGEIYVPPGLLTGSAQPRDEAANQTALPVARRFRSLTKRQREVVDLIGEGKTNAEIADELGLSESTVRLHVSTILDKLDVSNRTQVALLCVQYRDSQRPGRLTDGRGERH